MRKLHTGNGNPPPKDDPIKNPNPNRQPAEPLNPADEDQAPDDTSGKK